MKLFDIIKIYGLKIASLLFGPLVAKRILRNNPNIQMVFTCPVKKSATTVTETFYSSQNSILLAEVWNFLYTLATKSV